MLPLNGHRLLEIVLWISPHALLAILALVLWKRRSYRTFPCFLVYVLYEIVQFILLSVLLFAQSVTEKQYMVAYYATLMISVALRFGVIDEVSRNLFRESRLLKNAARRSLQCITLLLFAAGALLAVYAPGTHNVRWVAGISVINRGAALIQAGILLSLLLATRFLGIYWQRAAFGITLGLGILTSLDVAIFALRAEFNSDAWLPYLDLVRTGTYLVCISIWMGYLFLPELQPSSLLLTPHNNNEVETWNTELQHLLRH